MKLAKLLNKNQSLNKSLKFNLFLDKVKFFSSISNSFFTNFHISKLNKYSNFNFSKKIDKSNANEKASSKAQQNKINSKEEKNKINEEYSQISQDDLILNYTNKAKEHTKKTLEDLNNIVLKVSPKMFESIQVQLKKEKKPISAISNIGLQGSNIVRFTPFEDSFKELIVKALQTSSMELQINTEEKDIVVIVGKFPKDLRLELTNKIKKIELNFKESIKKLKHTFNDEAKKLEKIIGKDSLKTLEKKIITNIDTESKNIDKEIKKKTDEINKS